MLVDKRAFLDISAAVSAESVLPEPGVPCLEFESIPIVLRLLS